jgi:hypothetical protein
MNGCESHHRLLIIDSYAWSKSQDPVETRGVATALSRCWSRASWIAIGKHSRNRACTEHRGRILTT